MAEFRAVEPEVLDLATDIIKNYHAALSQAHIGFVYAVPTPKRHGKTMLAYIQKVSLALRPYLHLDYLVVISRFEWNLASLEARRAIIDHELCHAVENDSGTWGLRDHDVQEFYEIIQRHGLWTPDLCHVATTIQPFLELSDVPAPTGSIRTLDAPSMDEFLDQLDLP